MISSIVNDWTILNRWDPSRYYHLGVLTVKGYSTFSESSGLEPHHQMQFNIISRTLVWGALSLCRDSIFNSRDPADQANVEKLKCRTLRLLPPMSQPGFVVQRDNEWHAVYAGRTADVYMNPATVSGWIKKWWWAEQTREMKCDNKAV